MALTTKAKRRLALLFVLFVVFAAGVTGLYYYQQERRAQLAERERHAGLEAFEAGDHATSLRHLSRYHSEASGDGRTLYAYARSRLEVPTDDGQHVVEGMHALRRAVGQPDVPDQAVHELLELYNQIGDSNNALDLAQRLVGEDEDDVIAWRGKAIALARLNEHARALEAGERALEIEPEHWQTRLLTFQLRNTTGQSADALVSAAQELVETHPDDPRYELLLGYAHSLQGDGAEAMRWLRSAAERDPPDDEFLQTLVQFLDGANLYAQSRRVLEAHVDRDSPPLLYLEMARRMFEGGRLRALADRLEHVDPAEPESEDLEIVLAALRAMALHRLGEHEAMQRIIDGLEARAEGPLAETWAQVLRAAYGPERSTGATLEATDRALATYPNEALLRSIRAAAYEEAGEADLALAEWRRAAEQRPTWSVPRTRQARLLLAQDEPAEALSHAEAGLTRRPDGAEAAYLVAEARAATLEVRDAEAVEALLALIDQLEARGMGHRVMPLRARVLAEVGRTEEASERIRAALSDDPPPDRGTLESLAQLSRTHQLGASEAVAAELAERDQREAEAGTPAAALRRALARAQEGEIERGLALIDERIAGLEGDTEAATFQQWQAARAEYLQRIGDPRAAAAWIELAEAHPENPSLQQRALRSGAAEHDPAFAERALDRLRRMLGEHSANWRVERARWLIEAPAEQRDPAEAAELLEEVVSRTPGQLEPRLLLARAHEQRGLRPLAIRELTAAAEREPESASIALQLARLHQSMDHSRSARRQLLRVVESEQASIVERRQAATMLAAQGEDALALEVLEALHQPQAAGGEESLLDPNTTLVLAQLYQRAGRRDEALATLEPLVSDNPTPAALSYAARIHAAQGQTERAERLIEQLEQLDAPEPAKAAAAIEYLSRFGEPEQVVARYRQALDAEPTDRSLWHGLIAVHLLGGEPARAVEAAEEAQGHFADAGAESEPVLAALLGQRSVLASLDAADRLPQMIGLLMRGGAAPGAVAEAIGMLGQAHAEGTAPAALAQRMENLAEEHPRFLALQELAIRLHLSADRPDRAAPIAQRAMSSFPRAAGPAALAAHAFSATGEWREARRAAEAWRQRAAGGANRAADLMIAEAGLALGQPGEALEALAPYLEQARANPDDQAPVLMRYARGLIAGERAGEARRMLAPLLEESAAWRTRWMDLAATAVPDRATAERWLERVAEHIDEGAADERARLAQHWSRLATRFEATDLHARALSILDELVPRANGTDLTTDGSLWLQHAITAEQAGDRDAAEQSYRQALERDPDLPVAHNNLAMLLIEGESPAVDEAMAHAQRAVEAVPEYPHFLDTLAHVQAKAGDCDGAIETMQRVVRLQPDEPRWRDHLASILEGCGQPERVPELLEDLDQPGG